MKKKKLIAIVVVVLLAAVVCLCPIPRRVDVTLQGARLDIGALDDAAEEAPEETVEMQVHGWYLTYLLRGRQLKADLTISPCSIEGEDFLSFEVSGSVLRNPDKDFSWVSSDRYSAANNGYVYTCLCFNEDFSEVTYGDELDTGYVYAASGDENADLAAVAQKLDIGWQAAAADGSEE